MRFGRCVLQLGTPLLRAVLKRQWPCALELVKRLEPDATEWKLLVRAFHSSPLGRSDLAVPQTGEVLLSALADDADEMAVTTWRRGVGAAGFISAQMVMSAPARYQLQL